MKQETLWTKLEETKKLQRKRRWEDWFQGNESINAQFREINPVWYEHFICSLNKEMFRELMRELNSYQKEILWACASTSMLRCLLLSDRFETGDFFEYVPYQKMKEFFDVREANLLNKAFERVSSENQATILYLMDARKLSDFLKCAWSNLTDQSFHQLIDFLELDEPKFEEDVKEFYEKVTGMSAETIAGFLERVGETKIIEKILRKLEEKEKIEIVFQEIEEDSFVWQRLYSIIIGKQAMNLGLFGINSITGMYRAVEEPYKANIIFDLNADKRFNLYKNLTVEEKIQMLEIMSSINRMNDWAVSMLKVKAEESGLEGFEEWFLHSSK